MKLKDIVLFFTSSVTILVFIGLSGIFPSILATDTKKDTPSNVPPASIMVTGESATRIKDAYTNVLFANKDFQLAISEAKYNLSVPKGYEFNLATFSFEPPKPKEEAAKPK